MFRLRREPVAPGESPKYLFVGEDGEVFSANDAPTEQDLANAEAGILTIVDFAALTSYGRTAEWRPVPRSCLVQVKLNGELSAPFHVPAVGR